MREKLRIVVIDDDPLERQRLVERLLGAVDVEVVGEFSGNRAGIEAVERLAPDAIFLDVRLGDRTGFDLLAALAPRTRANVVFLATEREHAVRAFEVGALDYLVKPVEPHRLQTTLARLRAVTGRHLDEQASAILTRLEILVRRRAWRRDVRDGLLERLPVKEGGRIYFVKVAAIDWIESADNYTRLHTGATTHLVRRTLAQLEAVLDPTRFARIHRSVIVNLERIREVQPGIGRCRVVLLENGAQLRLSERYHRKLEQLRGYGRPVPRASGRTRGGAENAP